MYKVLKIENTYDWMMDTLNSKINRIIWIEIINEVITNKEFEEALCLNRVNKIWPAIILAVNRIVKVKGRIIFLIDSINTIKGINIFGVLCGIIWENMWFILFFQPHIINLNHRGKAIDKAKIICLDLVKI